MTVRTMLVTLSVCFGTLFISAGRIEAQQQPAGEILTNASVMKLVKAGFREKTVIAIINSRPTRFDLAPDKLIDLKKGGVTERVILAMISVGGGVLFEDTGDGGDGWDNDGEMDAIFGRRKNGAGAPGGSDGQRGSAPADDPGSVNIFGSSGGSRGRTRTRAGNGSSEGETETVGSATVRILRPPAESGGGAPPKLERTPTLTNDSVAELVEAGFTEGTIIRRIEQSPAEYDLRAEKLAELKKRRVPDTVIAAMRAAMSSDETVPAKP